MFCVKISVFISIGLIVLESGLSQAGLIKVICLNRLFWLNKKIIKILFLFSFYSYRQMLMIIMKVDILKNQMRPAMMVIKITKNLIIRMEMNGVMKRRRRLECPNMMMTQMIKLIPTIKIRIHIK